MTARDPAAPGATGERVLRLAYRSELDAIRGIAVLLVVLQHAVFIGTGSSRVGAPGAVGVTLFFVLSGYLITSLLLVEHRQSGRVDLRAFYVRRARRLWPALIALVAVAVVLGWPGSPLNAITYTANIAERIGIDMGYLTHTWTLAIEEQFYLVWPLAFLALVRWPRVLAAALVVVVVLSVVYRAEIGNLFRADALGAGCLLAVYGKRLPRWTGLVGWTGVVASCAVLGDPPSWIWTAAAAAGVLVVGSGGGVTWRPLVRIGTISYALYLWHYPVATAILGAGLPSAQLVLLAEMGGVALAIALALVSERFVERPFRLRRLVQADDHPERQVAGRRGVARGDDIDAERLVRGEREPLAM